MNYVLDFWSFGKPAPKATMFASKCRRGATCALHYMPAFQANALTLSHRAPSTQKMPFSSALSSAVPANAGHQVSIEGLASTFTDVVVRVALVDGAVQATRLTPDRPFFTVAAAPTWMDTARTYFLLGVEHILLGVDHLLFVLALLLLVRNPWMLVKVITAFTIAHSITLAVAALGWAHIPQAPVEAVIALSIMFVAAETIRERRHQTDLASNAPWIIAFAFGLLHGLGFGRALKEIGLPQSTCRSRCLPSIWASKPVSSCLSLPCLV